MDRNNAKPVFDKPAEYKATLTMIVDTPAVKLVNDYGDDKGTRPRDQRKLLDVSVTADSLEELKNKIWAIMGAV